LPFYGVVCDSDGGCVVAVYREFCLQMAEVFKGKSKNHPLLAIEEQRSKFSFSG
jgi:hypothetical protein